MKKTYILLPILIISAISGIYFSISIFNSGSDFKEDFNEFETSTELTVELDKGVYDLFELSTQSNNLEKFNIDYQITEEAENPKIIEIGLGTTTSIKKSTTTITYAIFNKQFKSIGQFEINKKQPVKIISKIKDSRIDKLAYRQKDTSQSVFGIVKLFFLVLFSAGGFLASGILLLMDRKKK